MSVTSNFSERETELLPKAIAFAQELWDNEERYPTQDEIQKHLKCAQVSAKNIKNFLVASDTVKVVKRLDKLPERAEEKALIQVTTGKDLSGSMTGHVLRENVRLSRALAKARFEKGARSAALEVYVREEIESLKELAKQEIKRVPLPVKPPKQTGLMLEINISDHHFGKLAWPTETGHGPYDLKIAEAMFARALDKLLERSSGYEYEQVVFVMGNDLLHANNAQGETFSGTVLDTEGRFQKTYWTVRKAMCAAIDKLRQIAPVNVIACYGNHDRTSVWTLADSVECYFHDDDRVSVDNQPKYRKYYQWGKNGFMFTHGDLGKRPDLPLVFATERPDIFGSTEFREIHTGHNHTTKTEEFHGVRVRTLPSLSPADNWHAENSYVGNLRNAEAFAWSKQEGLIAQYVYNDSSFPEIKTERKIV